MPNTGPGLDGYPQMISAGARAAVLAAIVALAAGCTSPPSPAATQGGGTAGAPSLAATAATPLPTGAIASAPPVRPSPAASPAVSSEPGPTAAPSVGPTAGASGIAHVIVVWMENREATSVTESSMPYLYGLAQTYGRADEFYAVTHPSLPNYLALWSGSTQGVSDDGIHDLAGPSLSSEVAAAGLSWRIFAQGYPSTPGCHTAGSYGASQDGPGVPGAYARKHVPAMSFISVSSSRECSNIQPLAKFDPGVNVALVVPNLCNDMHDCSAATGDAFLRAFLPEVFDAPDWAHTLLVVSFDEGTSDNHGGGRVFTLVARQGLSRLASSTEHDHYGLLRTIETVFGLRCLGKSCDAAPLSEFLP